MKNVTVNCKGESKEFAVEVLDTEQVLNLLSFFEEPKVSPNATWIKIVRDNFGSFVKALASHYNEPEEFFMKADFGDVMELLKAIGTTNEKIVKNFKGILGGIWTNIIMSLLAKTAQATENAVKENAEKEA